MRRKILFGITFICMAVAFNSCESLGTCKTCRQVTYDLNGAVISMDPEAVYCDADLLAIEAKNDQFVGNTRISWSADKSYLFLVACLPGIGRYVQYSI